MSFYPQPNKYTCGPFALKYALITLGVAKSEKRIAEQAGSNWWSGTDEIGLAKAAKRSKCELVYFHSGKPTKAIAALNARLDRGIPCILSVDNWEHWFTVINYERNKYIIIDSALEKVIQIVSQKKLLQRWKYESPDGELTSYDGYALSPRFRTATKASFTIKRAKFVMYERNARLARKWDSYFNDLVSICRPFSYNASKAITFTEFLRRYEKMLIGEVANWHGDPKYSELKVILRNMEFVANTYNLAVYEEDLKKTLVAISSILMMYACGKYGMHEIY